MRGHGGRWPRQGVCLPLPRKREDRVTDTVYRAQPSRATGGPLRQDVRDRTAEEIVGGSKASRTLDILVNNAGNVIFESPRLFGSRKLPLHMAIHSRARFSLKYACP